MGTVKGDHMELQTLATEVAKLLGDGWTASKKFLGDRSESSWRAQLDGPNEQELFFSNTWGGKQRLYIGGGWPDRVNLQQFRAPERPSITVSLDATPERIAKEISRRLLPEYLKALTYVLEEQRKYDLYKSGKDETVSRAALLVNGRVSKNSTDTIHTNGLSLTVSSPKSIRLERCDITLEQLEKIVAAVPELFDGESA